MELKAGYRQTEVGVIPEEWDVKKLGDIVLAVASGKSKSKSETGAYPLYGSTGIIGWLCDSDYRGKKILVARVGANAGTVNLVDGEYGVSDNTLIVSYTKEVDTLFSYHQLVNYNLNNLVFGSGQPLITGSQLRGLSIPLPPLPEQRVIATALSDVDALISALDKLIAKKRGIKQAAMQQLLTGKTRLPGFSGEWRTSELGVLFYVTSGGGKLIQENSQGPYFIIEMGSISETGKLLTNKKTNDDSNMLSLDDLVMPTRDIGEGKIIGKVAMIDKEGLYALGNNVYRLAAKTDSIDVRLFYYLINSRHVNLGLKKKVTKSVQLALNKSHVETQEVGFPSHKQEQRAIAAILSDMDAEISALETRRDKTRALKQGMMQELLTGRIRLT